MIRPDSITKLASRSRQTPAVIIPVMLLVLAAAIFLTARHVRHNTREQIIGRDGEILNAVARVQADRAADDLAQLEGLGTLADADNQMLVLLETSRLTGGAVGARLYSREGQLLDTFPADLIELAFRAESLPALKSLRPVSRFTAHMPLHDVFYPGSLPEEELFRSTPLLEVCIPLHTTRDKSLLGIAQFLIQGQTIAHDFKRLDQNLLMLGTVIFLLGGSILSATVAWSFRRLKQANALLADRTRDLVQANQELVLAAKSSAVGAVTAHLIHGLKNPLSGLQHFVQGLDPAPDAAANPESEWRHAVDSTRRMQSMINQVVTVLREQEGHQQYEVTLQELAELLDAKLQPLAREQGTRLELQTQTQGALNNRTANLVTLILVNLLQNALQASPSGRKVRLLTRRLETNLLWEIIDQGPGIPESILPSLFSPGPSTRDGGSGIGLAISKQLASHLGASLKLTQNSPQGCVFSLSLPHAAD